MLSLSIVEEILAGIACVVMAWILTRHIVVDALPGNTDKILTQRRLFRDNGDLNGDTRIVDGTGTCGVGHISQVGAVLTGRDQRSHVGGRRLL